MRLEDILGCYDINESPPKIQTSLLRAHFASLLWALDLGHLSRTIVDSFLRATKAQWLTTLSPPEYPDNLGHFDFTEETIESVWNATLSVFIRDDEQKYLQHLGALSKYPESTANSPHNDISLVSIQDSRMFRYWLRDGPNAPLELQLVEHGPEDVIALLEACQDPTLLHATAIIGRPKAIVWLTPKTGAIDALITEAQRIADTGAAVTLDTLNIAATIRNRLGLWKKRSPAHGVAIIFNKTYAAFIDDNPLTVKAPTALDAEGYDRFRHWPSPQGTRADAMGRGRTYELDPTVRRQEHPNAGSPEIITKPRPFTEIESLVYLGPLGIPPGSAGGRHEREAYEYFANDVAGPKSLSDVIVDLARQLGV